MIPLFPQFKKLELQDKDQVKKLTTIFPCYSDYNFTSLWCWGKEQNVSLSLLNGNLVVEFRDYLTNHSFLSFIGVNKITDTSRLLLDFSQRNNLLTVLKLIPEVNVSANENIFQEFNVREDRDNFDYVYSIPETIEFRGNRYGPKKNFVRRFVKLYIPHHSIIDLRDKTVQKLFFKLLRTWEQQHSFHLADIQNELSAIQRLVNSICSLDLLTIGLFVQDELIGFSVNEIEPHGFSTNLFEKANLRYIGAYQYLRNITAKYLYERCCQFLNHEQDLGKSGLRKSKLSYQPKFFLKKYIISQKIRE